MAANALDLLNELSTLDVDVSSESSPAIDISLASKRLSYRVPMSSTARKEGSVRNGIKFGGESVDGVSSVGDVSIALRVRAWYPFKATKVALVPWTQPDLK